MAVWRKYLSLDSHLWLPFANWLHPNALVRPARITDQCWIKYSYGVDWNLLGGQEMQILFPDAKVLIERWLGVPKMMVAYRLCG
jgi:hypothetical protein